MLVATFLVVLMMLMFAQVFGTAVKTLTDQRSLAANDQKARSITDALRGDLERATYRQAVTGLCRGIAPLGPGEYPDSRQQGFFYISENDPMNDVDDVLHFTVSILETLRSPTASDPDQTPYYGRARALTTITDVNQPDWDDGVYGNGVGASRAAEVCYFVRNGNLYRRVLLLRDPLPTAGAPVDGQPSRINAGVAQPFTEFTRIYTAPGGDSFYDDFDYSAWRTYVTDFNTDGDVDPDEPPAEDEYRLVFNTLGSLDNALGLANNPIAIPGHRFGYRPGEDANRNLTLDGGEDLNGNGAIDSSRPVEFISSGDFIGRPTHQETSFDGFHYPGQDERANTIYWRTDLDLFGGVMRAAGTTVLNGGRTGEDLLLPNVEAFNIEVWDPAFTEDADADGALDPGEDLNGNDFLDSGWVDLGNNLGPGYFALSRRANPAYGPQPNNLGGPAAPAPAPAPRNRVFDTWHPRLNWNNDATHLNDFPPFRPMFVVRPSVAAWSPSTLYTVNRTNPLASTIVFPNFPEYLGIDGEPGVAGQDDDGNGITDRNTMTGALDLNEVGWPGSDDLIPSIAYVAVGRDVTAVPSQNISGWRQPDWPRTPGAVVTEPGEDLNGNFALDPGEDRNGNMTLDQGVVWQAFDNRIGLERIRITVRYRDQSSGQVRQVTLIHSFVE
jgi:hypothetical protein